MEHVVNKLKKNTHTHTHTHSLSLSLSLSLTLSREFVSLASTSKPSSTGREEREFCGPQASTVCMVSQILFRFGVFKLMVSGCGGGIPGVCLVEVIWASVGDIRSERLRGAGRLPVV